ncbi:hypothetical protein RCL1_007692 [Eukaryota sp. TZLM3-RCL]
MNPLDYLESLSSQTDSSPHLFSRKSTPARLQLAEPPKTVKAVEEGYVYNIWYHKWSGGGFDAYKKQVEEITPAQFRVSISQDEGTTKADETPGRVPFCLYFARGCCSRGKNCNYLHRLPSPHDAQICDPSRDIFGRTRFASDAEDFKGVGSFNRDNRTILVSNFGMSPTIDQNLLDNFGEFGEILNHRVDVEKSTALIEYKYRANAEFAKEAMQGQSLGQKEVVICRWSSRDDVFGSQKRLQSVILDKKSPEVKKVHVEAADDTSEVLVDQEAAFNAFLKTLD